MNTANSKRRRWMVILRILLPILFVMLGLLAAKRLYDTRPKPKRRPPARMEPLVRVIPVSATTHTPVVRAYGEVIPSREVDLYPLVSGEVTHVHPAFREGGIIPAGERVITIDPRDYAAAVARAEAAVARAELELAVEEGAGEIAVRERALLGDAAELPNSEEALIRRDPHLAAARGALAAAEADLVQARLNLARTTVKAPFTALIQSRAVEQGGLASSQRAIAHIVDAETYWVRVSLPVDQLRPVLAAGPRTDLPIDVVTMTGLRTTGRLVGYTGTVEERGRMTSLLVAIEGPGVEGRSTTPLLGDYVQTYLPAQTLHDVVKLPQNALHDGDTVWLADADDHLVIRPVNVVWRDHDYIYVGDGLGRGDRVITTTLSSAVAGSPLRIAGSPQNE